MKFVATRCGSQGSCYFLLSYAESTHGPAKYVRPYCKGEKNDYRDAQAIADAVTFPRGTEQTLVDRVGRTFAAMSDVDSGGIGGPDLNRILALLDGSTGCSICGRPLRDEIRKLIGVGPNCAKQYGVPHSMGCAGTSPAWTSHCKVCCV
jgi:hypothetical protein